MSQVINTSQRHVFWKEHVQAYSDSGLSKAHYCRDNDLTYHQFIYWVGKFSAISPTEAVTQVSVSSKLVPVVLQEPEHPAELQLHLPNGAYISGISAESVGLIGRLVKQL